MRQRSCCWLLLCFIIAILQCHEVYSKRYTAPRVFGIKRKASFLPNSIVNNLVRDDDDDNDDDEIISIEQQQILATLRGGASRSKKKKKKRKSGSSSLSSRTASGAKKVKGKNKEKDDEEEGTVSKLYKEYKKILPITRIQCTMVGIVTLLALALGDELGQQVIALDPVRFIYGLELWRPLTAISYLGEVSIGLVMSLYHLFAYGSSLERAYGTSQYLLFLSTQMIVLTSLAVLLAQPFTGQSLITAQLHVLSRAMPNQKVKWLVITVPHWFLPLGFAISDALQAKNVVALVPHVIGMLSGHFYHFHKNVWPKEERGEDWLNAPDFMIRKLEPESAAGTKDAIATALKSSRKKRKRGKGRKLGKK